MVSRVYEVVMSRIQDSNPDKEANSRQQTIVPCKMKAQEENKPKIFSFQGGLSGASQNLSKTVIKVRA